jgi:hypothetical protein
MNSVEVRGCCWQRSRARLVEPIGGFMQDKKLVLPLFPVSTRVSRPIYPREILKRLL